MNILILLLFSAFTFSKSVSVQELIQLAESYSPQIKSENLAFNASEYQAKQARVLGNPIFAFQGGRLRSGSQAGGVTDFTLSQPLPWPGRRSARIAAQEFLKKLSSLTKEQVSLEVSHRVFVSSVELAALQELEKHYIERKRTFGLIQKSLQARPQVSPRQVVDRDLIEAQINIMEKEMIDLVARKEALIWEIKILTNSTFEKVAFNWENLPTATPVENYLNLLEMSPKGRSLKVQNELAANRIEEARLEARPDILVGVNYRKEAVAPVNHFYHGQVAIVIPILDRGQNTVEAARAQERRTKAVNQLEIDNMRSEVHRLYSLYEAGKKSNEIFNFRNIHKLERRFSEAEGFFRKGLIDANTFLQIDHQLHQNIDNVYIGRSNYISSLSQLNLLTGLRPPI